MWGKWKLKRDSKSRQAYDACAIKYKNAINLYHSNLERKLIEENNVGKFF
jgi:hypothetical protein